MDQNRNSISGSFPQRFHGLINQGSTCYLNSVLQVLFMTRDFREAVRRSTRGSEEHIDHQLQKLFENLSKSTARTVEVTEKLGIDRVNEQHDAAEYLEKILTLTSDEASQIFEGQLTHRTVCDCGAVSDEEKPFWNLPLPLSNSSVETYSVVDGIQEFFKDSRFHGDDQLYCEKCDAKRDATVSCILQKHPEVLMLLLKRFEFSYRHMTYMKNTRVVEVPLTVTLPENQRYELYALVDHYGSLKSGHYTATIRSQDRWYNFNDSSVTEHHKQHLKEDELEKSQTAYLLFYRKISKTYTDTRDSRGVSNTHSPPLDTSRTNNQRQHGSKRKNEGDAEATKGKVRMTNDRSAEESKLRDENLHDIKDHIKQNKDISSRSCTGNTGNQSHNNSDRHHQRNEGKHSLNNREGIRTVDPVNRTDDLTATKTRKSSERSESSGATGHTGREDEDRSRTTEKTQSDRTASRGGSGRETRGQQNLQKDCKDDPSSRKQTNHEHQRETKMEVQGENRGRNNRKMDTTEAERQEPKYNDQWKQPSDIRFNLSWKYHTNEDISRRIERSNKHQGVKESGGQGDRGMTPVGKHQQNKQSSETREQKNSSYSYSENIRPEAPLIKQDPEMENQNDVDIPLMDESHQTEDSRNQQQPKKTKKQSFSRLLRRLCCCCCQKKSGQHPDRRQSKTVEEVTETRFSDDSTPKRKNKKQKNKKQNQD